MQRDEADRSSVGDEVVDPVPDPLGIGVDAAHPDVGIEPVLEASIEAVQAGGSAAGGGDRPEVVVGREPSREVVPEERELAVVRRPGDGNDFHRVLRELPLLLRREIVDEQVLQIRTKVVRLCDVRDPPSVVRPGGLGDIELSLRELLRFLRPEVDLEDVLPQVVDEALLVEPEVHPADRADVVVILADVGEEQRMTAIGGPSRSLDPLLPPHEELGLAAVGRDHIEGVALVVLSDVPLRGEEDPPPVGRNLWRGVLAGGGELSRFVPVGGDDPQVSFVLVLV
jgi:hypothetical protein